MNAVDNYEVSEPCEICQGLHDVAADDCPHDCPNVLERVAPDAWGIYSGQLATEMFSQADFEDFDYERWNTLKGGPHCVILQPGDPIDVSPEGEFITIDEEDEGGPTVGNEMPIQESDELWSYYDKVDRIIKSDLYVEACCRLDGAYLRDGVREAPLGRKVYLRWLDGGLFTVMTSD